MKIVKVTNMEEKLEILDEDIIKDYMHCGEHKDDCNNCLAFIDLGGFTFCSLLTNYKKEFASKLLEEIEKL